MDLFNLIQSHWLSILFVAIMLLTIVLSILNSITKMSSMKDKENKK